MKPNYSINQKRISTTVSPQMILLRNKFKIQWAEALRRGLYDMARERGYRKGEIDELGNTDTIGGLRSKVAKLSRILEQELNTKRDISIGNKGVKNE